MRSAISDSAMRPVVIVLFDPTSDRGPRLLQVSILCRSDFLLLQAAMEPFDVAVAFRVMIGRASMRDAQPVQGFDEPGRSERCAVVGGQCHARLPAAFGKSFKHRLLDRIECFFASATMREIPAHDLPRAAVDHTQQVEIRASTIALKCALGRRQLPAFLWSLLST